MRNYDLAGWKNASSLHDLDQPRGNAQQSGTHGDDVRGHSWSFISSGDTMTSRTKVPNYKVVQFGLQSKPNPGNQYLDPYRYHLWFCFRKLIWHINQQPWITTTNNQVRFETPALFCCPELAHIHFRLKMDSENFILVPGNFRGETRMFSYIQITSCKLSPFHFTG